MVAAQRSSPAVGGRAVSLKEDKIATPKLRCAVKLPTLFLPNPVYAKD